MEGNLAIGSQITELFTRVEFLMNIRQRRITITLDRIPYLNATNKATVLAAFESKQPKLSVELNLEIGTRDVEVVWPRIESFFADFEIEGLIVVEAPGDLVSLFVSRFEIQTIELEGIEDWNCVSFENLGKAVASSPGVSNFYIKVGISSTDLRTLFENMVGVELKTLRFSLANCDSETEGLCDALGHLIRVEMLIVERIEYHGLFEMIMIAVDKLSNLKSLQLEIRLLPQWSPDVVEMLLKSKFDGSLTLNIKSPNDGKIVKQLKHYGKLVLASKFSSLILDRAHRNICEVFDFLEKVQKDGTNLKSVTFKSCRREADETQLQRLEKFVSTANFKDVRIPALVLRGYNAQNIARVWFSNLRLTKFPAAIEMKEVSLQQRVRKEDAERKRRDEKCRRVATILLLLRWRRNSELNRIPKDVVKLMTKAVCETYWDIEWSN